MGGLCHAPKPDIGPDSLPLDKRGELSANAGGGTKDPPNQSTLSTHAAAALDPCGIPSSR